MNIKALGVLIVGLGILGAMSLFTVKESQTAILLQFGKIQRTDIQPGLHFKIPVVQTVRTFDRRIQTLDREPKRYLTQEQKNVMVDFFVKWRISDVQRFYTATGGDVDRTNDRLSELIIRRSRDEFGKRTVQQVVSGERTEIMDKLVVAVQGPAIDLGIEIVDVRIKRVDLPEDVSQSVYNRMRSERQETANRLRSEGEEEARDLRAKADKQREVIIAEAEREAQITRGEGDALAIDIYAQAYEKDREFYRFYRSLDAYRNTFGSTADILLLEPNSEFFRYFKEPNP
ncbi:MAG: protease modulator HflC [Ectothiorhodospiraceae bacterium AqS1]|nr:protease modulator HflC [Ectothiorhodospiraceae bacterium AqS1]